MTTNWRDLPSHPVDSYDSWMLSLEDYCEMKTVYNNLLSILGDMSMVKQMMRFSARAESMQQSEIDAGEDI